MGIFAVAAGAALLVLLAGGVTGLISFVLRFVGALFAVTALLDLVVTTGLALPRAVPMFLAGALMWLGGQWVWAHRHHRWRTRLALRVFSSSLLYRLAPIPTDRQPRPVPGRPAGARSWPATPYR